MTINDFQKWPTNKDMYDKNYLIGNKLPNLTTKGCLRIFKGINPDECQQCCGTGEEVVEYIDEWPRLEACSCCGGIGEIKESAFSECPQCVGGGNFAGKKCPTCQGKGKVNE